jgi:hypothetical protein
MTTGSRLFDRVEDRLILAGRGLILSSLVSAGSSLVRARRSVGFEVLCWS